MGYQYLRARYYDPAIGRFISMDPYPSKKLDPETINRYVYVTNNPVNKTDPTGKCLQCAAAGLVLIPGVGWGALAVGGLILGGLIVIGAGTAILNSESQSWADRIEKHHLLPDQFRDRFERAGINIDGVTLPLPGGLHRGKDAGGLHTGSDNWNKQWEGFFERVLEEMGRDAALEEIIDQLIEMMNDATDADGNPIFTPEDIEEAVNKLTGSE